MKYKNFIVFDFETGGVDPRKNAAVEIALQVVDGNTLEFKEKYQSLIKPFSNDLIYTEGAVKVHGITVDQLNREGKEIQTVVKEVSDFITRNTPHTGPKWKPVLVGHNVQFDIGFFMQIFLFCKQDVSKILSTTIDIYGTPSLSYIDTQELTAQAYGHDEKLTSWKLGVICEYLGIELNDAHRAMNDTISTAELFRFYTKRLRRTSTFSNSEQDLSRFRTSFQIKRVN